MDGWNVQLLPEASANGEAFLLGDEKIGLNDYARIYAIPGLYEHVVQNLLQCASPQVAAATIAAVAPDLGYQPSELRVLDLGAGNGVAGELLRKVGVGRLVGVDNLEEARTAAIRDRPDVYDAYVVGDLESLGEADLRLLESERFNCLFCVGALGGGHIAPLGLRNAFDLIQQDGLVVLTIHEKWLRPNDAEGFSSFMNDLVEHHDIAVVRNEPFVHRLTTAGVPINFFVVAGRRT